MKLTFISFMLLLSFFTSGQQIIKTYYNKDGIQVTEESESHYYVVKNHPLNSPSDEIKSYFTKTNTLRSVQPVTEAGQPDGESKYYHENGKLKTKIVCEKGYATGEVVSYYSNGRKQSVESYDKEGYRVLQYWDSAGNQVVKDGNGFCRCVLNIASGNDWMEMGKFTNGVRDSIWLGFNNEGRKRYEEKYDKGKLINGTSFDDAGDSYDYTVLEEQATPDGGITKAYEHVSMMVRYPALARRTGIEGKVYVEFVVEKDGTISNVKVIRGIGGGCDEIAVQAVETMQRWIPARQRGKTVRQKMILPIGFKLEQDKESDEKKSRGKKSRN